MRPQVLETAIIERDFRLADRTSALLVLVLLITEPLATRTSIRFTLKLAFIEYFARTPWATIDSRGF
jgi:hypothetical protein